METNDAPRRALCELVARYGRDVTEDVKRCEGLIRDLCPANRREANVLIFALKERIPADLLSSSAGVPKGAVLARLSKRLDDNLGLEREFAKWAVESWALALGVISAAEFATEPPVAERTAAETAVAAANRLEGPLATSANANRRTMRTLLGDAAAQLQVGEAELNKRMVTEFSERKEIECGMHLDPEKRPLPSVRRRSELLPLIDKALRETRPWGIAAFVRSAVFPFMVEFSMQEADRLAAQDKFDESHKYAYLALEVAPYLYEAFRCLADCAFSMGKFDTAIQAYSGTATIFPNEPDLNYQLGRCHFEMGRFDEALNAFKKELTISGERLDLCIQMGSVDFEKGRRILDEVAARGIRDPQQIRQRVGDCFKHAEHWYQRALAIDPNSDQVRGFLEASQKLSAIIDRDAPHQTTAAARTHCTRCLEPIRSKGMCSDCSQWFYWSAHASIVEEHYCRNGNRGGPHSFGKVALRPDQLVNRQAVESNSADGLCEWCRTGRSDKSKSESTAGVAQSKRPPDPRTAQTSRSQSATAIAVRGPKTNAAAAVGSGSATSGSAAARGAGKRNSSELALWAVLALLGLAAAWLALHAGGRPPSAVEQNWAAKPQEEPRKPEEQPRAREREQIPPLDEVHRPSQEQKEGIGTAGNEPPAVRPPSASQGSPRRPVPKQPSERKKAVLANPKLKAPLTMAPPTDLSDTVLERRR